MSKALHKADIVDAVAALCRMAEFNPEALEMIELYYLFGIDADEFAAVFKVSEATGTRKTPRKSMTGEYVKAIDALSSIVRVTTSTTGSLQLWESGYHTCIGDNFKP